MKQKLGLLIGILMLIAGLMILVPSYAPLGLNEISYQLTSKSVDLNNEINPVDGDFGIVIPKIGANASIIAEVDPYNEVEYQQALTRGIAGAKNTASPGEIGNMFLFSHSAVDFFEASKYNSIFYLLNKLDLNDDIYIYKDGSKFNYQVTDMKKVDPSQVEYLQQSAPNSTLTLMTCWPPGTTLKRLIVEAELKDD